MHQLRCSSCLLAVSVAFGLVAVAGVAGAQEHPEHPKGQEHPAEHPTQAEMQAAMEQMMALGAPGEHHRHLARMVGEWTYEGKFLLPGAEQTSTGTMSAEAILGGRFVRATWRGEFLGQPFEGIGIDGYDNIQKKHVSVWMDGMGTSLYLYSGHCDGGGKETTMTGTYFDAMEGREVQDLGKMIWLDDNAFKLESYRVAPDGSRRKTMEIVARRRRS